MAVRRLLGAALMVPLLFGGLLLVTAEPAAACPCVGGSEAERAARANAIFVGTLISQVTQIDPRVEQAQREFTRTSDQRVLGRALMNDTSRTVWTFEVSRVYKGAVGERQEIVAPPGGPDGANCSGVGRRHPARSHSWCSRTAQRVTGIGSNLVSTPRTCAVDHGRWLTVASRTSVGYRPVRPANRTAPRPRLMVSWRLMSPADRPAPRPQPASRLASGSWPRRSRPDWDCSPSGLGVGPAPTRACPTAPAACPGETWQAGTSGRLAPAGVPELGLAP